MPNNTQMNQSQTIEALQKRLEELEGKVAETKPPVLSQLKCKVVTKGLHRQLYHRLFEFLGFPQDEKEGAEISHTWWVGNPGEANSSAQRQTAVLKDGMWRAKAEPELLDKSVFRDRKATAVVAMAGMMTALLLCLMPSSFGQLVGGPVVPVSDVSVTNLTAYPWTNLTVITSTGAGGIISTNGTNTITGLVAPQTPYLITRLLSNTNPIPLFYGPACIFSNMPTVSFTNYQFGTSTIQTNLPINGVVIPTSSNAMTAFDPWVLPANTTTNLGSVGCQLYGFTTNAATGGTIPIICTDIKVGK